MSNSDDTAEPKHKPVSLAAWCRRNLSQETEHVFWRVFAAFLPPDHKGDIEIAKEIMSHMLSNVFIVRKINADEVLQEIQLLSHKKPVTEENLEIRLRGRGKQILNQRENSETKIVVGQLRVYKMSERYQECKRPLLLCAKCHTLFMHTWHFEYSNIGPVSLCEACKESVLRVSFPKGGDAFYGAVRSFRGRK
jgi:hypothetical protein